MDNKKLGIIVICISVVLLVLLAFIRASIIDAYQIEIDRYTQAGKACPTGPNLCPHEQRASAQIPIFAGGALLIAMLALGIYLVFFEKSQKAILATLEKQKTIQTEEEKFNILLKGLSNDEKKVVKAIKEQDGITQQTLRLRTDLHKSKLSIILDGLEKKDLIKRVEKGKTKQVFLKIVL